MSKNRSTKSLLFFTIIMLIKSYLAWFVIFEDGPSWSTWLKEIPFVLIVFCLIEWFTTKKKLAIYVVVNLLLTAIFFAVIMYYKYYGVIVTYHALEQVNQVTAVSNSVLSLLSPQYLLIFTDIIVIGAILFRRKRAINWKLSMSHKANRKAVTILFCVCAIICLMNIFPNRASMNEIVKAEQMGILNYEAYTLFANNEVETMNPKLITQASINQLKGIQEPTSSILTGSAKGKNVIIIQLESFQNFLINLNIDGTEITPVMNSLVKNNFHFPNFYQNVGQGNTSDAEFVVNTSFYIPPIGAATQVYAGKELPSLPKLLIEHGYDTTTFHTNVVEFWNRGELYKALGFDRYYDKAFFGSEDDVYFGASDEVLYAKTSDELALMDQKDHPFYAHVISMTAHHPYTIPDDKYRIELPERFDNTMVSDYIRSQNYADYALGVFIEDLKKSGVWDNSLVYIYGDHLGLPMYSLNSDEKVLMEEIFGRKYSYADMINIPLVITSPGVTFPARYEQIGGQIDILPSIANMLGISLDHHLHFGQDLLNQNTYNLLPQRYYLPTGSFINNKELFLSGSGFEDGKHYTFDLEGEQAAKSTGAEFNRALDLLHLSDSYVNQLPDRE